MARPTNRKNLDSVDPPDGGARRSAKRANDLAGAAERVEIELLNRGRRPTKKLAEIDEHLATLEAFHKIEKSYLKNSLDPRPIVIENPHVTWVWIRPSDPGRISGTEEVLRGVSDLERVKPWDQRIHTLWQPPRVQRPSNDMASETINAKVARARARRLQAEAPDPPLLTADGDVLELMDDIPEPPD